AHVPDAAWKQFAQAQTAEEFCGSWLVIQANVIGGVSDGVVVLQKPGGTSFAPVAFFPEESARRSHLASISERVLAEGRGVVEPVETEDADAIGPRYQLAYPVRTDGQVRGVVGVDIDWRNEAQLQSAMRDLQWGSAWLELFLRRHADPMETSRLRLKLALELVSTLLEQEGLKEGAAGFATELASRLGCDRVIVGLLKRRHVRVVAVSHSAQFDRKSNLLRAVETAMEEATDQVEPVVYPPDRESTPVVSHAHEMLTRESGAGSAVTYPLMSGEKVVGALSLERPPGKRFDLPTLELCEAVAAVAGPIIDLKHSNERSLPVHAAGSTVSLWKKIFGPGHPGLKLVAIAAAAVLGFLAVAVGDYRISANTTVEGVVQRAVSAPFDGYVSEAPFRAGDLVQAGEPIVLLDDRELRLERIKLVSQREQYRRQYRQAMAERERAKTEIVGAQIEQTEAQLAMVEEQLSRARLVAPFDGFIVVGDLSQSLGSPVERGDVLFEVAPLDGFRMVLEVDEGDIADVIVGQTGELAVSSMPDERFDFTVSKITPVNEAKDGRNYFRVEAQLTGDAGRLRPGMEGVGKIFVEERKIIWIWTRSLVDWVRLTLWSWAP
ncbi:MAG TPA: HlyD family efflux transporter periplasmic adaptor subunit, partial [Burkholderiales bacterium]|nr:HlyD family efflux transporter periplasmic adaptor subunit [Burkholderiales bacterium]